MRPWLKVPRRAVIGAVHPSYRNMARRLAMPRYYFHVRRGQMTVLDQQGIELADTADAEVEAAQRAQQIVNRRSLNGGSLHGKFLNGQFLNGRPASRGRIIVADDNWQTLFELPF